jgi:hypothetical protein
MAILRVICVKMGCVPLVMAAEMARPPCAVVITYIRAAPSFGTDESFVLRDSLARLAI